jgi:hypothetical protein
MGTSCSAKAGVGPSATCNTVPFTSSLGSTWDWNCNGSIDSCSVRCTSTSNFGGCQCNSFVTETKKVGFYNVLLKKYSTDPEAVNPCAPTDDATFCSQQTTSADCTKEHLFFDNCCDSDPAAFPPTSYTCANACGKKIRTVRCTWNSSTNTCSVNTTLPICNPTVYNSIHRFFGCR